MKGTRLAATGLLVLGLIGLWKALALERWSFEGPGPGLFPSLVALVFVALAIAVILRPGKEARDPEEAMAADDGAASSTEQESARVATQAEQREVKSTFRWTAAALIALAIGPQFAGFAVTTLVVCALVLRGAERRSWSVALSYGLIAALIGLVLFGGLLRVDLPVTALDRTVLGWVR